MRSREILAPLINFLALSMPISAQNFLCGPFVPIFMLHRMECPDLNLKGLKPEQLANTLELLRKNKFNFVSLETAINHLHDQTQLPPRSIVFTMDDGFHDHYAIAAPIFDQYDSPATFFLITDFINRKLWPWDDQIAYIIENCKKNSIFLPSLSSSHYALGNESNKRSSLVSIIEQFKTQSNSDLYENLDQLYLNAGVTKPISIPDKHQPMSWDNARDLIRRGHSIGAHTKTHRILSMLNQEESKKEILESINDVNQQTGQCSIFAYPTGRPQDYGDREIDIVQSTDVKFAVSTTHQSALPIKSARQMYQIPRFSLPENKLDLIQYSSWIETFKNRIR